VKSRRRTSPASLPRVTFETLAPVLGALGIGVALAGAPGPVQAILLTESIRGGMRRGIRALLGAFSTWASLLLAVALGVSLAPPEGLVFRALRLAGGLLLIWLALDGLRADATRETNDRGGLSPFVRGSLAVALNPGAWLFLGAVASPIFASASTLGGTPNAVLAALAMMAGTVSGDLAVVLIGAFGMRRIGEDRATFVRRLLAVLLGMLGVWLLVDAFFG
jgi:threonine/homoserine/homoserine lactone efflux protein